MLEKEDLLAIAKLIAESEERMCARMDSSITASEERMCARMDSSIAASEERMCARMDSSIAASEERTNARIDSLAQDMRQDIRQVKQDAIQAATVMMESYFDPKFKLLAENQQLIMENMVPKCRVDDLEDEVKFIKVMVRQMADRVSRLEKAN